MIVKFELSKGDRNQYYISSSKLYDKKSLKESLKNLPKYNYNIMRIRQQDAHCWSYYAIKYAMDYTLNNRTRMNSSNINR